MMPAGEGLIAAQLSLSARLMTTGRSRNRAGARGEPGVALGGRGLQANVSSTVHLTCATVDVIATQQALL